MKDNAARRHLDTHDDTVDNGLTEDLLGPGDGADADAEASVPGPAGASWSDLGDDDDYLAPPTRRGKLTTGLLVALIFLVGILLGAVLSKTLSPAPAPQIVYVLNDSGASCLPRHRRHRAESGLPPHRGNLGAR